MEAADKVATRIAYLITAVWAVSLLLDAAWKEYDPPSTVHALMMIVAGWAFGQKYFVKKEGEAKE